MGQYLGEKGAVTEVRVAIEIGLEKEICYRNLSFLIG